LDFYKFQRGKTKWRRFARVFCYFSIESINLEKIDSGGGLPPLLADFRRDKFRRIESKKKKVVK
jgi:hypothetical protein